MAEGEIIVPPALPPDGGGPTLLAGPTIEGEPRIHGIVGAYYGDIEVDVGKAVRWLEFYVDDLYIQDINTGEQRYWVINWAASFPNSEHGVSGNNFFLGAPEWRQEQFEQAEKAWNYADDDWVIFIDGSEGLSFDNRSLPDDYLAAPFMAWMYRETTRATGDVIVLPVFVYLNNSDLQNVSYQAYPPGTTIIEGITPNQAISVPWYLPNKGLPRMFKVSALRDPDFDWASLDVFVDVPDAGVKMQIVAYSYAHWQPLDIPPGETEVAPLSLANDVGWKQRSLMSMLRPVPGLPFDVYGGTDWSPPEDDPDGVPGPWAVDTMASVDPEVVTTIEEDGHTAPDSATAGVLTPLYDTVFRLNLRDGLWYERGASGNIPLAWDEVNQVWVPRYNPDEWPQSGVDSTDEPPPPQSLVSLFLDGVAGSYCWTSDANSFDFDFDFTLEAEVQLTSYATQEQTLVAKWSPSDGRSWNWGITADGEMFLDVSHDGLTLWHRFVSAVPDLEADLPYRTAVAFVTNVDGNVDEARFWLYHSDTSEWHLVGDIVTFDNEDYVPVFNSTAQITVGGSDDGDSANAEGLFHRVSVRSGIGETNIIGGTEAGLMRGDLTDNPTYDRYGNLWTNEGGWTYLEMDPL